VTPFGFAEKWYLEVKGSYVRNARPLHGESVWPVSIPVAAAVLDQPGVFIETADTSEAEADAREPRDPQTEKVSRAAAHQIHALDTAADIPSGALAKAAGISHSMLSRIERGTAAPSIETLTRISVALDIPLSRFFVDQSERRDCSFLAAGQAVTFERDGSAYGHACRLLGHVLSGSLFVEPYIVTLDERAQPCSVFQNIGLEFIHVLEGEMRSRYGSKVYPLKLGDTLLFDAHGHNEPEEIRKTPVKYLAVVFNIRDMN
jgi:DNA-binding XRE family transcriptional regulator